MPSGGRSWGVIHTPESAWFRPQQHEQAREPSAPPEGPAEPRSATGVVGTSDRAHSGAEQRARTTAVATLVGAHIGTYACARDVQASSA